MSTSALEEAPARARRLLAGVSRGKSTPRPWAGAGRGELVRMVACGGVVIVMLVIGAADDGAYDSVTWLGGAIGLVVLGVWSRLVFGRTQALGRFGRLALGSLTLYAAWSFLSITWASDKGAALIGADRTLLYLVLFWLLAGLQFTRSRLELSVVAYLLCLGGLALAILVELAAGPAPQLLISGQLAAGLGYHNGTAALGTIGTIGSVLMGCSRHQRPLVRAGLMASAAACLELSLLAQSRGWLYTLPIIVAIVLAIIPRRGRAVAWALIPSAAALATLPWVQHGWAIADGAASGSVAGANVTTARSALVAVALAGLISWLLAHAQLRYRLSRRGRRATHWLSRSVFALALTGVSAAGVYLIVSGRLARGWHQFTTDAAFKPGTSRFSQLGSGRYDFWRVAFHGFLHHPLGGLGQDNFAQTYLATRHTGEEPLWVHSLELRLLAHTGLIGALLFAAFVVCALIAYRRAARVSDQRLRFALAAALVPLVVWFVHGSIDWFWELPALSGAAFAFLGAAVALEPGRGPKAVTLEPGLPRRMSSKSVGAHASLPVDASAYGVTNEPRASLRRSAARLAPLLAVAATALVALVALVPAYIGERALNQGRGLAATNPRAALGDLSLASKVEPWSVTPLVVSAGIELRDGRGLLALRQADAGLRRDPSDWVLWLERGMAAGLRGRSALERLAFARAHGLDPLESLVGVAQQRAGTAHPLTIQEAAAVLAARDRQRVQP